MAINWDPTPGEDIAQNVRTLLRTAPGTVPLSRALGTPQDVVDTPISEAGARLQAAVVRAVRTYEPRVKVKQVTLAVDGDSTLKASLEIG